MNKNIIIGILIVVSLLSLGFGYFQSIAATKARIQAEWNLALATEAEKRASTVQKMADVNASEAIRQHQLYEEVMKNCKERK